MKELLTIAISAALDAGRAIMDVYNSDDFDVQLKSDDSPLTKADIAANTVIESYLNKTEIPVLSEEGKEIPYSERKDWKQLWIVDPIDGTKEFIKKNGDFTVNIALVENQQPVLGVIYVPALKVLYYSIVSEGAFKAECVDFDEPFGDIEHKAVKLPEITSLEKYTVVGSKSHMNTDTEAFINEIRSEKGEIDFMSRGSSLKLCMVAEGKADVYPRFAPTMEWDTAAGSAIVLGAGKDIIDVNTNKTLLYNREKLLNPYFIVK